MSWWRLGGSPIKRRKIFSVTIGSGRKLFAEGTRLRGFALVESSTSPSGVIIVKYKRAGEVKIGSFALAK